MRTFGRSIQATAFLILFTVMGVVSAEGYTCDRSGCSMSRQNRLAAQPAAGADNALVRELSGTCCCCAGGGDCVIKQSVPATLPDATSGAYAPAKSCDQHCQAAVLSTFRMQGVDPRWKPDDRVRDLPCAAPPRYIQYGALLR